MTNREKKAFKKKKEKEKQDKKKLLKRREAARLTKKTEDEMFWMQREVEKIQNKANQIRTNRCTTSENGTQI